RMHPGVRQFSLVAWEMAVFNQHRTLRRIAFVVDVERAAAIGDRSIVDDGHAARPDALADPAGKRRRTLAVETALESVADRLVQQDAGPAMAQHDAHRAGGS